MLRPLPFLQRHQLLTDLQDCVAFPRSDTLPASCVQHFPSFRRLCAEKSIALPKSADCVPFLTCRCAECVVLGRQYFRTGLR